MVEKLQHQSLDRGITIMEILSREGACSLADLHRFSGISKSSIRRLLGTLVTRRLVRRSFADQLYRMTMTLPDPPGDPMPAKLEVIGDFALPVVSDLTRQIEWPSDIHILDGARMRILDSTRSLSPFHIYPSVMNRHINIFGSATGMCCLAQMSRTEISRIVAHTSGDELWGLERFKMDEDEYLTLVAATRARKYGVRIASKDGGWMTEDGLSAIACPIITDRGLLGAVSIIWPRVYQNEEQFAARYFSELKAATVAISDSVNAAFGGR